MSDAELQKQLAAEREQRIKAEEQLRKEKDQRLQEKELRLKAEEQRLKAEEKAAKAEKFAILLFSPNAKSFGKTLLGSWDLTEVISFKDFVLRGTETTLPEVTWSLLDKQGNSASGSSAPPPARTSASRSSRASSQASRGASESTRPSPDFNVTVPQDLSVGITYLKGLSFEFTPAQSLRPDIGKITPAIQSQELEKCVAVMLILRRFNHSDQPETRLSGIFHRILELLFPRFDVFREPKIFFEHNLLKQNPSPGNLDILLCDKPNPQYHTPKLVIEIRKPTQITKTSSLRQCACYMLSMIAICNTNSWKIDSETKITKRVALMLWDFGQRFLWMDLLPSGRLVFCVEQVGEDYANLLQHMEYFLNRADESTPFQIQPDVLGVTPVSHKRPRPSEDGAGPGPGADAGADGAGADAGADAAPADADAAPTDAAPAELNLHSCKRQNTTQCNAGMTSEFGQTVTLARPAMLQLWLKSIDSHPGFGLASN